MATFTRTTTLGQIVTARPSLARELDRRGLDYCCGGAQTIEQACVAGGLDADTLLVELDTLDTEGDELHAAHTDSSPSVSALRAPGRTRADTAVAGAPEHTWATMGPAELVDHLEATHHRYLWAELPRLSELMAKVLSAHGERHPELVEIAACADEIRADLEPHLVKEERVLFPMVRELASASTAPSFHCGSLRNPISVMLREHDVVGELLRRLRTLTGDYTAPQDGCESYAALFRAFEELEADTHLHIHKENNLLFPAVEQLERRFDP